MHMSDLQHQTMYVHMWCGVNFTSFTKVVSFTKVISYSSSHCYIFTTYQCSCSCSKSLTTSS